MERLDTWVCTDPDNHQYGRKISKGVFEFKEFDRVNYSIVGNSYEERLEFVDRIFEHDEFWTTCTVDLSKYSDELKENVASSYYGSLEDLKNINADNWEWILAECIFEIEESYLY